MILAQNQFTPLFSTLIGWGLIIQAILVQLNEWRHWSKNRHHGLVLTDHTLITPFGLNTAALLTIPYEDIGRVKIYTNAQNEPRSLWLACGKHGFLHFNRPFPELTRFISLLQEKIPAERFQTQRDHQNYIPALVGVAVVIGAMIAGNADSPLPAVLVGLGILLLAAFAFIPQKYYAQPSFFENPAGAMPGEWLARGVGYLFFFVVIGFLLNEWVKEPCVWWNKYVRHSLCVYELPAGEWVQFTPDEQALYLKDDENLTRYPLSLWPTWRINPTLTSLPTLSNQQQLLPDGVTYLQLGRENFGQEGQIQQWNLATGQLENTAVITPSYPEQLAPAGDLALSDDYTRLFNPLTGETTKELLPGRWFLGTNTVWAQLDDTPDQLHSWKLPDFSAQYALSLPPEAGRLNCLTVSADDQTLAITTHSYQLFVLHPAGQTFTFVTKEDFLAEGCEVALSPDGQWLLVERNLGQDGQLSLWSTTTTQKVWSWTMPNTSSFTFSPSGRYFAVSNWEKTTVFKTPTP